MEPCGKDSGSWSLLELSILLKSYWNGTSCQLYVCLSMRWELSILLKSYWNITVGSLRAVPGHSFNSFKVLLELHFGLCERAREGYLSILLKSYWNPCPWKRKRATILLSILLKSYWNQLQSFSLLITSQLSILLKSYWNQEQHEGCQRWYYTFQFF